LTSDLAVAQISFKNKNNKIKDDFEEHIYEFCDYKINEKLW